ncbi:synaptic vesicle glycoprotein 2B isoform X1 [Hemiscyllium ocellatum]|uniref:synaptic vesicle glycoprotein 2B isoform X1 n=1 Tax=Hemiscyllium ocellatum TaxID=170820 RepID=UPI002967714F|nr:synaptic vesicle glycoprotein 2B isoform X1 [Hemiscyllium ocellatum]
MALRDREPLLRPEGLDVEGEAVFERRKSGRDSYEIALTFEEAVEETGFGTFHIALLAICGWANASDAVEILCVSFLLPTARCDLYLSTADMGWLTASVFLGMMVGGYMWGVLADLKGRQRILVLSLAVNGIFGAVSSLASNYWQFLLLRFISGVGVGGSIPVIFSYFSEFQPRNKRGCMVSALATFWMAGNILAAGLAWLVIPRASMSFQLGSIHFQSWRLFVLLCSVPSLTSALIYAMGMPESPKYLMQAGREVDALQVFQRMFYWNHRGKARFFSMLMTLQDSEVLPRVQRLAIPPLERSNARTYESRTIWFKQQMIKGLDPIRKIFDQKLCTTSIVLSSIFFSISFGYYGLWMWFPELLKRIEIGGGSACSSNWSSSSEGSVENVTCYPVKTVVYKEGFIIAAANLPGNIFTILLMDLLGGKFLLGASLFLSGICAFFIWQVKTKTQSLIVSCVFSAISVVAWNSLDVIGLELYPTNLRSSALGVFTGISRVASILGNVVFGQLVDMNCSVTILLVAAIFFIGSLACFKLPNTKHIELS